MKMHDTRWRPKLPMEGAYTVEFKGNKYAHVAEVEPGTEGTAKKSQIRGSWYGWVDIDPPPELENDLIFMREDERNKQLRLFADTVFLECQVLGVSFPLKPGPN
ncbi:MAG: hypothetical protein AAFR94_09805 [Pseudomonadota bacterium]